VRDGEARRLTSERFSTACRHHDGKHNHSDSKYEYLNLVCHGPYNHSDSKYEYLNLVCHGP